MNNHNTSDSRKPKVVQRNTNNDIVCFHCNQRGISAQWTEPKSCGYVSNDRIYTIQWSQCSYMEPHQCDDSRGEGEI